MSQPEQPREPTTSPDGHPYDSAAPRPPGAWGWGSIRMPGRAVPPAAGPPGARGSSGGPPVRHRLALATCGLTLLCGLAWVVLALSHPHFSDLYLYHGGLLALAMCFSLVGAALVVSRKAVGLGAAFLVAGLLRVLTNTAALAAAQAGAGGAVVDAIAVGYTLFMMAEAVLMMVFPLGLPDGRLPGSRAGRSLTALTVLVGIVLGYFFAASHNDLWWGLRNPLNAGVWARIEDGLSRVLGDPDALVQVGEHVFVGFMAFNLLYGLVRWYRTPAPRPNRLGIVVPYVAWSLVAVLPYYLDLQEAWLLDSLPFVGTLVVVPSLVRGYLRDRSLSMDRATLRWLGAYTFSTLLYVLAIALTYLVHELLPEVHWGGAVWWWSVLAALVAGLLLRPAAGRVFHAVDRYYYGDRAQPYLVARRLAEQLRRTVDPAETPRLLCRTVVGSLGMPAAAVRVHGRDGQRELAALGDQGLSGESFPLSYEGLEIGDLVVAPRAGESALDRQDAEVLQLLADQASPAIASLRLYEDLQASRKQLVLAREEERRRLRHDLHDGLGPALSGLRLQVDAARESVTGPAAGSLASASAGIGQAITELRRITDGLAPAALGSEGLGGALRQLAERLGGSHVRIALDLTPDPLPALPAAVEVAVYRISGEALNNVVRHSGASDVRLVVRVDEQDVTVEAQDNGAGFPAHANGAGVGLRSMAERAEELGGCFSASNDLQGAVVRAVFPRPNGDSPGA
ncbi:histidine kinase [Kitasatospora sp. NPDC002227]|uniref:sensor histidine kinase n=1 Tax=Kitasatospora sp. NPDC002227 TaxID=3154773 RepID=UPI0033306EA3